MEDDQYCSDDEDFSDDDSDSELEAFTMEDTELCIFDGAADTRYGLRERPVCLA